MSSDRGGEDNFASRAAPKAEDASFSDGKGQHHHFGDLMGAGQGFTNTDKTSDNKGNEHQSTGESELDVNTGGAGNGLDGASNTNERLVEYKGLRRNCTSQTFGYGGGSPFLPSQVAKTLAPLERILATANGNLQRIVSSWCNRGVTVRVTKNEVDKNQSSDTKVVYDRSVELWCDDSRFGIADSTVTLESPELIDAVSSGRVGIGQLFRQFDMLPAYKLLSLATMGDDKIDRLYTLSGEGIMCEIREVLDISALPSPAFPKQVWPVADHSNDIDERNPALLEGESSSDAGESEEANDLPDVPKSVPNHYGDVMAGTSTSVNVHDGRFRPFERVLLTANGNVQRLLSSFLNEPVDVHVLEAGRPQTKGGNQSQLQLEQEDEESEFLAEFYRHAQLRGGRGEVLCDAESQIRVKSEALNQKMKTGPHDIGAIFGKPGTADSHMPHFELLETQRLDRSEGYSLFRRYILSTAEVEVEVTEKFQEYLFENDEFVAL